ncbi:MAG: serine hydrolase [Opitutales bacterium]|nr:serine hydrolase [Opitutales bacterium]
MKELVFGGIQIGVSFTSSHALTPCSVRRSIRWIGCLAASVAGWIFGGCSTPIERTRPLPADPAAALDRALPVVALEDGTVLELGLADWMAHLAVPGLSIALINDFEVVWAQGFGVTKAGGDTPVTPDTLFQAASISKPVTALTTMLLVEEGRLGLDIPVNEFLGQWQLLPAKTTIDRVPTLRELLGHTGGLPGGGFFGYDPGSPFPTLLEMLDALPPANNPAARIVQAPGESLVYGGMGYMVVQKVLTERTGADFVELTERRVFTPLGLSRSTFAQPLPEDLQDGVAGGHTATGRLIPGGWRVHTEQAAAGLWTTPGEAALIAIETARAARGLSTVLVTPQMAETMLTPHREDVALGWMRPGGARGELFSHSGANFGFRAYLLMHAETGQGLAVMTNADSGERLLLPVISAAAEAFHWPWRPLRSLSPGTRLALIDGERGPDLALADFLLQHQRHPQTVSPQDLHEWGNRLFYRDRVDDALRAFRKNADLYPENKHIRLHLARAYFAAGHLPDAERIVEHVLALAPDFEPAIRLQACLRREHPGAGAPD